MSAGTSLVWAIVAAVAFLFMGAIALRALSLKSREELVTARAQTTALRERIQELEQDIDREREMSKDLRDTISLRDQELASAKAGIRHLTEQQERERAEEGRRIETLKNEMKAAFADLSSKAVGDFLTLARDRYEHEAQAARTDLDKRATAFDSIVKPVQENLRALDAMIKNVEKERIDSFAKLSQRIESLVANEMSLMSQTASLRDATTSLRTTLQNPSVRGQWGEIQLRRVVGLGGMVEHCDFNEQETQSDAEGRRRADMLISVPGSSRRIPVDAKCSAESFLAACAASDENSRREYLTAHAKAVRERAKELHRKDYARFQESVDFVVMFIPGEAMLSAALSSDPTLLESAAELNVFICGPMTLISLLRSYAAGWSQLMQERNAKEIAETGRQLYRALTEFVAEFRNVGERLRTATRAYNEGATKLESRVLGYARRFEQFGAHDKTRILGKVAQIGELPTTIAPNLDA